MSHGSTMKCPFVTYGMLYSVISAIEKSLNGSKTYQYNIGNIGLTFLIFSQKAALKNNCEAIK